MAAVTSSPQAFGAPRRRGALLRRRVLGHARRSLIGAIVLLLILLMAVLAPLLAPLRSLCAGPRAAGSSRRSGTTRHLGASARHRHARPRLPLAPDLRRADLPADRRSSVMLISGLIGTTLGLARRLFRRPVDLRHHLHRHHVRLSMPVILVALAVGRACRQLAVGRDPRARPAQMGPLRGGHAQRHAAGAQRSTTCPRRGRWAARPPRIVLSEVLPNIADAPDRRRDPRDGERHPARGRPLLPRASAFSRRCRPGG